MPDEDFHEIQLNGKQLVFLFMAATVVSVVIFLCGVLVGRGVRAGEPQASESATAGVAPDPGSAAAAPATVEPPAPAPPVEDLSYPDRLQRDAPLEEVIASAPLAAEARQPQVAPQPPVATPPASNAAAASGSHARLPREGSALGTPAAPARAAMSPAQAGASGFVVQVAALRDQRDADVIAKQLVGKGYPAYVLAPAQGAPAPVYRVQVGKFSSLREADETAARLEKEEHFKPWIRR